VTLLVGVLCSDGVVVAADSFMTLGQGPGQFTISHQARKIEIVSNQVIVAGTGQVGLGQRFAAKVKELWGNNKLKGTEVESSRIIAEEALKDFSSTGAQRGSFGALVAFPKSQEVHLCEFASADMQPELKTKKAWFVSMGSGQSLADPYLALMRTVFWSDGPPNVEDGKFAAVWVVQHVLKAAPGFVGPPVDVAVLKKEAGGIRASFVSEDELEEHLGSVADADRHFGTWKAAAEKETVAEVPSPPSSTSGKGQGG
jgi:20S proteasome alpha/beta subunit